MGTMAWTFMPQEIRTILGDEYDAFVKERERHGIFTVIPATNLPTAHRLPSNPSANSADNVKITVDGSSRSSSTSRLSSPGSHNSSTAPNASITSKE